MKKQEKNLIKISGRYNSQIVFSGIFKLTSTLGVPLTDVLQCFKNNCVLVDWIEYYNMALNTGMNKKRIFSRISEALTDVYYDDVEYKKNVLLRLNYAIDNNYSQNN